jgi:hypothetical protein
VKFGGRANGEAGILFWDGELEEELIVAVNEEASANPDGQHDAPVGTDLDFTFALAQAQARAPILHLGTEIVPGRPAEVLPCLCDREAERVHGHDGESRDYPAFGGGQGRGTLTY